MPGKKKIPLNGFGRVGRLMLSGGDRLSYEGVRIDTLNVREKATVPDLSELIPNPLRDIQNMNGLDGYALGVKSVCDRIARYIEEYKGIRVFTSVMEIDNVIALLERIRQESGADNIKL